MPIFTFDAQPEVSEVDGKFSVNIPDEMATTTEKFSALNTSHTDLTSKFETANTTIAGYNGLTAEDVALLQTNVEAYKKNGDPTQLGVDLATSNQANKTLQAEMERLTGLNSDLSGFKNNTIIGAEIRSTMKELLKDSAGKYEEVYKTWINQFELNSDNKPVTKEGFTVRQFAENTLKQPGYQFMQPSSNGGNAASLDGGGSGTELQRLQAKFIALGKGEKNGRTLSERLEVAAKIKELTK